MTVKEAIAKYTEKYGGWPYFLFMGSPDDVIVGAVEKALASGEKIKPPADDVLY